MEANEFSIQWHLTNRCNLNCMHCYETRANSDELSLDEAKKIILEISSTIDFWSETTSLIKSIHFTGGEPLLSDILFPLISFSQEYGFIVRVMSNGTLIDKIVAQKLKTVGVLGVQISIDDIGKNHDTFRGVPGCFQNTIDGIENLIKVGIPVTISCTLSKFNHQRIEDLIKLSLKLGVNSIRFPRLVPIGNAKEMNNDILTKSETREVFRYIYKKHHELKDRLEIVIDDPLFSIFNGEFVEEKLDGKKAIDSSFCIGGCSVGFTGICILPDGTYLPCRKLPVSIGNAKCDNFRDVWIESKLLNDIRDSNRLEGICGRCNNRKKCKGCRAIAYSVSGNYLGDDPQCWHNS